MDKPSIFRERKRERKRARNSPREHKRESVKETDNKALGVMLPERMKCSEYWNAE